VVELLEEGRELQLAVKDQGEEVVLEVEAILSLSPLGSK